MPRTKLERHERVVKEIVDKLLVEAGKGRKSPEKVVHEFMDGTVLITEKWRLIVAICFLNRKLDRVKIDRVDAGIMDVMMQLAREFLVQEVKSRQDAFLREL